MAFIGRDPKQPPRTLRHMQKVRRTLNGLLRNDILTQLANGEFTIDHGGLAGLADDDHTQYLLAAGTRALTANWDAGSFQIRAETFQSDVATGTAPFTVASTTAVTNLNADLLDGQHASAFEVAGAVAAHEAAGDPHPQYLTAAEGDAAYQPLDTQLTDLAGLAYAGNAAKVIAVTAGEDGFELVAQSGASLDEDIAFSGDISPAQITADQNDYSPTGLSTASTLRLTSDAVRVITGLAGGADGRILIIHNIGSFDLALADEDTNSTAANRFTLSRANEFLVPDSAIILQYDSTSSRWRAIGQFNLDASVGAGNVARGHILYRGATRWLTLSPGTADQFLITHGSGADPAWNDVSNLTAIGEALADADVFMVYNASASANRKITAAELLAYLGSAHLLATATASASATVEFDFTDWTNTDYMMYLLVWDHVAPATDNVDLWVRTSTDGGANFDSGASDYGWARQTFNDSGGSSAAGDAADAQLALSTGHGNAANEDGSGWLMLFNPSVAGYGQVLSQSIRGSTTNTLTYWSLGGRRLTAADIDAIQVLFSSGNIASGTFRLYGFPVAGVGSPGASGGGDLELLATATASASATVDFTLTGWTNSDYAEYILVMTGVAPATDNVTLWLRTSTDGGANYDAGAGNYRWVKVVRGDGGGSAQTQSTGDTEIEMVTDQGNAANEQLAGEVRIFNPSAAQYCRTTWFINYTNPTGNTVEAHGVGTRVSAADVDAIRIMFSSGNIASGEFKLYGKKAA